MTARVFHKHTYTVEVLSEDELPGDISLEDITYEITDGHCVGKVTSAHQEISGEQCAKDAQAFGSDPEFFRLTESGDDMEED